MIQSENIKSMAVFSKLEQEYCEVESDNSDDSPSAQLKRLKRASKTDSHKENKLKEESIKLSMTEVKMSLNS